MTSYTNASSDTSNDNSNDNTKENTNDNTKRNKKTQALSALLSATALGVFLEGCGGGTAASTSTPTPAGLGSQSNPFVATATADTFTGSAGADWVSYAGSDAVAIDLSLDPNPASVAGAATGDTLTGIQNLIGTAQGDTLTGNGQANTLRGGEGLDTIYGGAGSDIIEGGAGLDMLNGGTDSSIDTSKDTLSYANEEHPTSLGVAVNLETSTSIDNDGGTTTRDTIAGFENVIGSRYNDKLTGDELANRLDGGAGNDEINGGAGDDTINGDAGADTYIFRVGDGADTITEAIESAGTSVINLQFLNSDLGNYEAADFAEPDSGDPLFARDGDNLVISIDKAPDDNILDQVTINNAYNSDGNLRYTINVEYGSEGSLTKIAAADAYWNSEGSESKPFLATTEANAFTGSAGADWVSYARSDTEGVTVDLDTPANNLGWAAGDTLTGVQNIIGTEYDDVLTGSGQANTLQGNDGGDIIEGGAGSDIIDGGAGVDTLNGGAGADTYIFRVEDGTDTITDVAGDTMTLQFLGAYEAKDFKEDSTLFGKDGDNLVISIDKNTGDGITDQVTINDAFDANGKILYTINVEYGSEGGILTEVTEDYWNSLGTVDGDGSESNPFLATASVNIIAGSAGADWVSYAELASGSGVNILLNDDLASVSGAATGDMLTGIQNIAGTRYNDLLQGNGEANSLRGNDGDDIIEGGAGNDIIDGGTGVDTLNGGTGDDTLNGEGGTDNYIFASGHGADTIAIDADGGNLFFRAATSFEHFSFVRGSNNNVKITVGEDSVEFLPDAYAHGRYTLHTHTGAADEILGVLIVGAGETLTGSDERDVIIGTAQTETINGGAGGDLLDGGAGDDTYIFRVGDGEDIIVETVEAESTITLQFIGAYEATDFTDTNNFAREGDNLVISIDKDTSDDITDKVTINNAYDTDSNTGTDNAAYTINIQYGAEGSETFLDVENAFWHTLGA